MFCLPSPLSRALWEHTQRELPNECVGMLGGKVVNQGWQAVALYPLGNIAMRPEYEYLADPGHQLRALRSMAQQNLELVGLYHSHPSGPSFPSRTDLQMATYSVPYLIANLKDYCLNAYLLPEGKQVTIVNS